jgi:putative addiction module component (TIGR02574 family)
MSDLLNDLESRAAALSASDRAALALHLLRSLEPVDAEDWESAWIEEANRRWSDLASGRDTGRAADEVLARARSTLR